MTRVPFGTTLSLFLLSATIQYHLKSIKGELKKTADLLGKPFYVDDLLTATTTEEEALQLHKEANDVMIQVFMPLKKWTTHSPQLLEVFDTNGKRATVTGYYTVKVLDYICGDSDTLKVGLNSIMSSFETRSVT